MENGHGWPRLRTLAGQILTRLPQFCCFCHRKTDTGCDLCQFCQSHLPPIVAISDSKPPSSICLRCGFAWADTELRQECAQCVNYQTGLERIICPYRYDFPIDGIIRRLKYQQHLPSGRLLGHLLANEVDSRLDIAAYPDYLLPVPLSLARQRMRGFNHAAEIARWCARQLHIECHPSAVGRRVDTGSLVGLSRAERGLRIRGAFWAHEALQGCSVAIIDDVMTTGATAGEFATELLDHGVREVQLWVIARTPATGNVGGS